MSDLVGLKFPVAAHHRLICDVGRRNEAAMKWHLRGLSVWKVKWSELIEAETRSAVSI